MQHDDDNYVNIDNEDIESHYRKQEKGKNVTTFGNCVIDSVKAVPREKERERERGRERKREREKRREERERDRERERESEGKKTGDKREREWG